MTAQQIIAKYEAYFNSIDLTDEAMEQFFIDAERDMDAALAAGTITSDEYCDIERELGF